MSNLAYTNSETFVSRSDGADGEFSVPYEVLCDPAKYREYTIGKLSEAALMRSFTAEHVDKKKPSQRRKRGFKPVTKSARIVQNDDDYRYDDDGYDETAAPIPEDLQAAAERASDAGFTTYGGYLQRHHEKSFNGTAISTSRHNDNEAPFYKKSLCNLSNSELNELFPARIENSDLVSDENYEHTDEDAPLESPPDIMTSGRTVEETIARLAKIWGMSPEEVRKKSHL